MLTRKSTKSYFCTLIMIVKGKLNTILILKEKMMEVQDYLSRMKKIQEAILTYIEEEDSPQKNYMKLIKLFITLKIQTNKHDLKTLLHIISNIADNHYRGSNFFNKIQKIFEFLKFSIKNNFSNYSIFNIFRKNKIIILLLIQ